MFRDDKLVPKEDTVDLASIFFKNVRSSSKYKTRRKRKCAKCDNMINEGDLYIKHEYKYDYRILFVNYHVDCY